MSSPDPFRAVPKKPRVPVQPDGVVVVGEAPYRTRAALGKCPWPTDPDARHRQIHELVDRLAEARKEIAYLEQTIARGRPRLMEREGR